MYVEKLETADLILAKAKISDLEDIYHNSWCQPETARFTLWKPCENLTEARERLVKVIDYQSTHLAFFVYLKTTKQAIGQIAMIEIEPGIWQDAGISLGKDFVRHGYGKQILTALINYIFDELDGKKVICSTDHQNIASAKLQQSCGMKYTHSDTNLRKWTGETFIEDFYEIYRQ